MFHSSLLSPASLALYSHAAAAADEQESNRDCESWLVCLSEPRRERESVCVQLASESCESQSSEGNESVCVRLTRSLSECRCQRGPTLVEDIT